MKNPNSDITITDGSLDWSEGVNSDVVTTIQSELNPNGLKRNQVSWMDNATTRGGGLIQRNGFTLKGVFPGTGIYQGSFTYQPDFGFPYLIFVRGGDVWKVDPDTMAVVNLSAAFGLSLPLVERVWFCQAEQFLIIQAGDGVTLPLFWDGALLRQSVGITNPNATPASGPGVNEIPPAQAMCYYLGRVWYAQGRQVSAGDIVGSKNTGTLPYRFKDSVLNVTENPLCVGGDGFTVPTSAGNIRGIAFASNLNSVLGQGALYVGTREQIYSITVPMSRTDWINADAANGPTMVVALETNGWVNDRSIVTVNGDLFFQSLEPSIRSFTTSVRNFQQWGNVPISINENRMLQFVDRALMHLGSGIYFDNRLLETSLPYLCPVGIAHKALAVLNFDVISTFERQLPPCWEGMWEGLNFLEIVVEDYGGRERAFTAVWSDANSEIQLWEITSDQRWEKDGNNRVSWYVEFPAFTWGSEFMLKKLVGGELWLDKLLGEVVFRLEYRPDGDPCWYRWHEWKFCTAKDSCENVHNPVCVYPAIMRESYRQMVSLPIPPNACASTMGRPSNIGYQFQVRLSVLGWVRIRGLILHAEQVERKMYENLVC